MKIELESAYVLHARPYRETSLLVDFFTERHGKIAAVARSARGARSRFKGYILPFAPLLISCGGKGDLLYTTAVEAASSIYFLERKQLFSGLYLNELLSKLLQRQDPHPTLFRFYSNTLIKLNRATTPPDIILREFEVQLIAELGYALRLTTDTKGDPIVSEKHYRYHVEEGPVGCDKVISDPWIFQGSELLSINQNEFQNNIAARRLMRLVIGHLLGGYQLKSRDLFA